MAVFMTDGQAKRVQREFPTTIRVRVDASREQLAAHLLGPEPTTWSWADLWYALGTGLARAEGRR
jgi:hypothetical protein